MSERDSDTDGSRPSGWHTWGARVLPALTFVVGLALGLLVMTAADDQGDSEPEADPAPSESAAPSPSPGDTVVTVPAACQEAAASLSEATRLLDDVAGTIRDFQPQQLVDLLNELETLDAQTREQAAECSDVSVSESASPSDTTEPSVSEEPSDSPS